MLEHVNYSKSNNIDAKTCGCLSSQNQEGPIRFIILIQVQIHNDDGRVLAPEILILYRTFRTMHKY